MMVSEMDYRGIITPMITPVKNNQIDFSAMEKLLDYLNEINVEGIFPASSTGAFTLFSFENHKRIIEFSSDRIKGNTIFLPGISRNNLEETISMGKIAQDLGANGAVIITPYYLKFNQDAIYTYYSKIAERLDIHIFVYNNPDLSCNTIEPETLVRLFDSYPNIMGIKDSSGDMRRFNSYLKIIPKDKYIFQGRDDLLYESLLIGASGGVCGTSNFSSIVHELYLKKEISIHRKIVNIMEILRKFQNHISYNYIFRKKILKEKSPKNFAMEPFHDLDINSRKTLDALIDNLKEYE